MGPSGRTAGRTTAPGWWAAALSGLVAAVWATVGAMWDDHPGIHLQLAIGVALATATLLVGLGYLMAWEVRSHAQAASAGLDALGERIPLAHIYEALGRAAEREAITLGRERAGALGSPAFRHPSGQPIRRGPTRSGTNADYAQTVPFLPLTILQYNGRTVLAFACACGEPIERGAVLELEDGHVMVCHQHCLERL